MNEAEARWNEVRPRPANPRLRPRPKPGFLASRLRP